MVGSYAKGPFVFDIGSYPGPGYGAPEVSTGVGKEVVYSITYEKGTA